MLLHASLDQSKPIKLFYSESILKGYNNFLYLPWQHLIWVRWSKVTENYFRAILLFCHLGGMMQNPVLWCGVKTSLKWPTQEVHECWCVFIDLCVYCRKMCFLRKEFRWTSATLPTLWLVFAKAWLFSLGYVIKCVRVYIHLFWFILVEQPLLQQTGGQMWKCSISVASLHILVRDQYYLPPM